ncbi:hypothetical protein EH221_01915 [bacterium]|nr:MAG: hypothetical protein EH221_01915 [bacterium]
MLSIFYAIFWDPESH